MEKSAEVEMRTKPLYKKFIIVKPTFLTFVNGEWSDEKNRWLKKK